MKEGQITGMTEDLITGSKEDQTRANKKEGQSLNLQGSNVLVARDMVTGRRIVQGRENPELRLKSVH